MDRKEARKIVNGSVNWRGARPPSGEGGERRGRDKRLRDGWPLEERFPTIVRAPSTYTVACVLCKPVIFWTFAFRFSRDEIDFRVFGPRPGHRAKFSINGGKNIFSPTSVAASLGNVRARILFRTIDTRSSWFDAIIKTSVHECMRDHRFPLPSEINN